MRVSAIHGSLLCLSLAAAVALLTMSRGFADDDELTDPFLGQPDAIAAGRVTYAGKCYVCHHSSGARDQTSSRRSSATSAFWRP
jgi:mono/diheme cytochrome c family protein